MLIRKFHILTMSLLIMLCFCATTMSAEQKSDKSLTPFERELNDLSKARQSREEPRFDWRLLESQRHFELAVGAQEFSNSLSLLYYREALIKYASKYGDNKQNPIPLNVKDDAGFNPNISYHDFVYDVLPELTHNAVKDAESDIIQCMLFVSSQNNDKCLPDIVKTSCNLGRNDLAKNISESAEKRARTFTDKNEVTAGLILAAKCQLNLGNTQKAVELITETHGIMDNCSAGSPHKEYQELMFMFADTGEHDIALEMFSRLEDNSEYGSNKLPIASIKRFAQNNQFDLCVKAIPLVKLNNIRSDAVFFVLDKLDKLDKISDTEVLIEFLNSLYQSEKATTSYYERCRMLSKLAVAFHRIGNTKLAEEIIFNDLRFSKPDIAETINIKAIYFPISALVELGHKETAIEITDKKLKSYQDRNYPEDKLENEYFILASCYLCAGANDKAKSLFDRSVEIFPKDEGSYLQPGIPRDALNAVYGEFGNNSIMINYVALKYANSKSSSGTLLFVKLKNLLNKNKIDEAYEIAKGIKEDSYSYPSMEIIRLIEKLIENHHPDKALEIMKNTKQHGYLSSDTNPYNEIAYEYASLGDYNTALNIVFEQEKNNDRLPFDCIIEALAHFANSRKFNEKNELKICEKAVATVMTHKHRISLKSKKNKVDSLAIDDIPALVLYITSTVDEKYYSPTKLKSIMDRKSKSRVEITQAEAGVTVDEYLGDKYQNLIAEKDSKGKFDNLLILAKQYSFHGYKEKAEEILEKAHELGLDLVLKGTLERSKSFYQLSLAFAEIGCIERAKEIKSLYWIEINVYSFKTAIAYGYVANGNIQQAADFLTQPGYPPVMSTMPLVEILLDYQKYDKAYEMFEMAAKKNSSGYGDQIYSSAIRFAEAGRFNLALKVLGNCYLNRILADVLNEIDRLRIEAGYELTEDELINLRMIVHNDIYFCKYPLVTSKEKTQ
ncbi:hypothetical protein J7L05_07775 [bacterium]|nr:hypothetical protein [bacterium]